MKNHFAILLGCHQIRIKFSWSISVMEWFSHVLFYFINGFYCGQEWSSLSSIFLCLCLEYRKYISWTELHQHLE